MGSRILYETVRTYGGPNDGYDDDDDDKDDEDKDEDDDGGNNKDEK